MALSTIWAEYTALCEAREKGVRRNKLVQGLASQGLRKAILGRSMSIKVDNSGCVDFCKNPIAHKRTKHADIRYHCEREAITAD